jgi:hypothetical protein
VKHAQTQPGISWTRNSGALENDWREKYLELFTPDILLPIQQQASHDFSTPEMRLWIAVLLGALEMCRNPDYKLEHRFDAIEWICSPARGPASFEFVCEALGLDPVAVRAVVEWRGGSR